MNFNASSSNSENLRFDVLLLLIAYKMHLKKYRRIVSLDNGKRSKLWSKTDFSFEKWHEKLGEI